MCVCVLQGLLLEMNPQQSLTTSAPFILSQPCFVSTFTLCTAASARWPSPPCTTGAAPETRGCRDTAASGRCPCTAPPSSAWRPWGPGCWARAAPSLWDWQFTLYSFTCGSSAGAWGWACWGPVRGITQPIATIFEDWWLWIMPLPGLLLDL